MIRCQRYCFVALILTLLLRTAVSASADTWICPGCGNRVQGNYCCYCGQKRPNDNGYLKTTFSSSSPDKIGDATVYLKKGFDFINEGSSYKNMDLALTAVTLSAQVYKSARGMKTEELLYELGYDDADFNNTDSSFGDPGVCFGYKQLEDGKNIFAAIVRGTDTTDDLVDLWTDLLDGSSSMFEESGKNIESQFKEYIENITEKTKEELLKEDNYFFFAGHSLGGAIANYLSVNDEIMQYVNSDKEKIYTYTFESPHTCIALFWMSVETMSNAFNYKVVGDAVTNLPPYSWSTTYGKDIRIKVSELSNATYKSLFADSVEDTIDDAVSVDGHSYGGDIFGLHDICLNLIYLYDESGGQYYNGEDDYPSENDDLPENDYPPESDDPFEAERIIEEEPQNDYIDVNDFVIEGKWKNIGNGTYGQAQRGAIVVFDGSHCSFYSPFDTYAFYKNGNDYRLDCTGPFADTVSFTVNIVDDNNINIVGNNWLVELSRVG